MNLKDITLDNIKDYIQGYSRWFMQHWRLLADYEKEQILYRASQCPKECAIEQKCFYCKCDYPQKLFVDYSCNKGKELPNLMGKKEWEDYKQKLKNESKTNDTIFKTSN